MNLDPKKTIIVLYRGKSTLEDLMNYLIDVTIPEDLDHVNRKGKVITFTNGYAIKFILYPRVYECENCPPLFPHFKDSSQYNLIKRIGKFRYIFSDYQFKKFIDEFEPYLAKYSAKNYSHGGSVKKEVPIKFLLKYIEYFVTAAYSGIYQEHVIFGFLIKISNRRKCIKYGIVGY